LLATVFAILILPTLLIQEFIFRNAGFGARMLGLAISGTIIILTMRRIETFLINITDKYLFQKKYDYKELLKTFTVEVLTVLEMNKLVNLTVTKLTEIVKMDSCAVLLFDDDKQQFYVMASQNIKDTSVTMIRPDGLVTFMDETHGYLLMKEMREKKITVPDSIQEIIDKLNAELVIPMVVHDEVIGVLSLGKKKSDGEYTQDDLDILLPLSRTLAIAISNAKLFDQLGKAQAEAAQREKMAVIGTLSAGINHEICNPLGIARGQCEAFLLNLKDGLYKSKTNEELLVKAKDIMAKVIKETDRATSITKKLSGFAKPSKGEEELVDVSKEVDEVLGLVGYELKLDKIEFRKEIDDNIPNLFVDRKQFQEVLFNLIRNAGQAIGDKGRITVFVREEDGVVHIDIQDTGSGISEDKVKQLFNPFFTTKDPGKGTGLGLFIVRQVVEKNGGHISLKETKIGEGTTFRLEFPTASERKTAHSKKG
jgi:signal transduction histidine kinase